MPNKPLPDKWHSRDFPVLVEITRRVDDGDRWPQDQAIADAVGMPLKIINGGGSGGC